MSHAGNGVHGEWRRQSPTSFARIATIYGERLAWRVWAGVDLSQLPATPDVFAGERQRARRVMRVALSAARRTYNHLGRVINVAHHRGLITLAEFYRLDDEGLAACNSAGRRARMAYAATCYGLNQLEKASAEGAALEAGGVGVNGGQ